MTERYDIHADTIKDFPPVKEEHPLMQLRFARKMSKARDDVSSLTLQQLWLIREFTDKTFQPVETREWRDVPFVDVE